MQRYMCTASLVGETRTVARGVLGANPNTRSEGRSRRAMLFVFLFSSRLSHRPAPQPPQLVNVLDGPRSCKATTQRRTQASAGPTSSPLKKYQAHASCLLPSAHFGPSARKKRHDLNIYAVRASTGRERKGLDHSGAFVILPLDLVRICLWQVSSPSEGVL